MTTLILFIVILSLLVFVHEAGHFITARKAGMKVYEFGFGFPPRAFGVYKDPGTGKWVWVWGSNAKRQKTTQNDNNDKINTKSQNSNLSNTVGGQERDEEFPATLYSVNWLPLGGFVKIKGENGEAENEPDSFGAKPFWKKATVLVAGVTMNVILAAILLGIGFMIGLPTDMSRGVDENAIIVEESSVMVQQVVGGTPADEAGLRLGDRIVAVNGEAVTSTAGVIRSVDAHGTSPIAMTIRRGGAVQDITLAAKLEGGDPQIGAALADAGVIRYPWYVAIWKGVVAAVLGLINIFIAFYFLLKGLILGQGMAFDVSGPVGIASIVGQSAQLGFNYVLNVAAMISLSLAAINILPIPALDGGRLLFVTIEKVTGKPVPLKYEQLAHTIGFLLLMLLIIVVTWRDIAKLL